MIQQLHVPSRMTSDGFFIGSVVLFFGFVGCGLLSQKIGRRLTIAIAGFVVLSGGSLLYFAAVAHALAGGAALVTTALGVAFYVLVVSPWGIVTTYICERFPTHIRASGYGIGYSVAVIIPSFTGFYMLWLAHLMPYVYTPIVLLMLAGVMIVAGVMMGPETREVELHLPDLGGVSLAAARAVAGDD